MMEHDQKSVATIIYGLLNLFIGSTSDFIGFLPDIFPCD